VFENAIQDMRSEYVEGGGTVRSSKSTKLKREFVLSKEHDFRYRVEKIKILLIRETGVNQNRKLHPLIYDLMAKYWPVHFKKMSNPKALPEDIRNRKASFINSILKQKISNS
jgi:hypothetical protein